MNNVINNVINDVTDNLFNNVINNVINETSERANFDKKSRVRRNKQRFLFKIFGVCIYRRKPDGPDGNALRGRSTQKTKWNATIRHTNRQLLQFVLVGGRSDRRSVGRSVGRHVFDLLYIKK